MRVLSKERWKVTASSGDPRLAIDDHYATMWISEPSKKPWLKIDLGEISTLGGLEVYWGKQSPGIYGFKSSVDGKRWTLLCRTRHGEGGQDVFAFPPVAARFVRFDCDDPQPERGLEIVEINLYDPADAASVKEDGRIGALGYSPVKLLPGESITVDLGHVRSPLGALIEWGETYGTVFSTHLSDDGDSFREMGRITTGNGGSDSFWWRSTTSRYLRLTVHEASSPEGAVVNELKLRILNKDRMPIGQLERAALAGPGDLYPQSLLGRQIYWTALGEYDRAEEALFDEYGNLEPRRGSAQITPLLRVGGALHGAPSSLSVSQSLVDGSLPIPTVAWSAQDIELRITALAHAGEALAEYRITNRSGTKQEAALVLAVRPVQINPYWQHGGHAVVNAIAVDGPQVRVNDRPYAAFSADPDATAVADFDDGDVIKLIEKGPRQTVGSLRSEFGPPQRRLRILLFPRARWRCLDRRLVADEGRRHAAPGDALRRSARDRRTGLAEQDRPAQDHGRRQGSERHGRGADGAHPRQFHATRLQARSAQLRPHVDSRRLRAGARAALDRSDRRGQEITSSGTPSAFTRTAWSRPSSTWTARSTAVTGVISNSTHRANLWGSRLTSIASAGTGPSSAPFSSRWSARRSSSRSFAREPTPRAARRCIGLLAPSISHEGYSNPSYSYWDDYFASSAWRNCEFLAREIGDRSVAAHAAAKGREFAANLTRSIRMTAARMETGLIPGSADRDDVDPSSTSIAFEPCRVEDVLPAELIAATYDRAAARLRAICAPDFQGNFTPYELRNLNAFVSLGRYDDAFRWLSAALTCRRPRGWRSWAEVVWSDLRAPDYIGDMPHTWIGAEFITAIRRMLLRENGGRPRIVPRSSRRLVGG